MGNKLIGIIIVIVVLGIVIGILGYPLIADTVIGITLIGIWIYLFYMVRKKRASLFHDRMEPEKAEKRYKLLKVFLFVAGISFVVAIIGTVLHAVLGIMLKIEEEVVSFFVALIALWVFIIAIIGSMVIFLKGRKKQAKEIPE